MQPYTQFYTPFAPALVGGFLGALIPFLIIIAIWTFLIKGYALWHAARNNQKGWFIALLVINTLGILEIVYLIWFSTSSNRLKSAVSSSSQS